MVGSSQIRESEKFEVVVVIGEGYQIDAATICLKFCVLFVLRVFSALTIQLSD